MAARAEKDIRNAIGSAIATAVSTAIVIPRNLLGNLKNATWYSEFLDVDNRVHGWGIALYSDTPSDPNRFQRKAEYLYKYHVWQLYEFTSGNDASNSEDLASVERDTVKALFVPTATSLCGAVRGCGPLEFGQSFIPGATPIDTMEVGDRILHIAQGQLTVADTLP